MTSRPCSCVNRGVGLAAPFWAPRSPPLPARPSSPPSRFATLRISCSLFLGHLLLLGPLHSHRPCENRDLRQLPSGTYSAARRLGRAQ